jgi:DNA-binding NarL/FixJ family response regulator
MTLSVILVDDHALVREGLARLIDSAPEFQVAGQGACLADGYSLLAKQHDLLVVDVSMPDGSGLSLARYAREHYPNMGIVVVTMHNDDETLLEALDAGASALVLKSDPSDDVLYAVRQAVHRPRSFVADGLSDALRRRESSSKPRLTPRETEVMASLLDGASVSQVARSLYMSESTVKTHIARLYDKLGVHNRAALAMAAVQHGLVPNSARSAQQAALSA